MSTNEWQLLKIAILTESKVEKTEETIEKMKKLYTMFYVSI